ncbi:hypothetical protein HPB50_002822 [Hyalomma asiaticum]|uniref:Uncharacterized protein n=1 Tax=Hyalomma asiaticum TaxID=266040 RepID=A0ACB7SUR0_HYAAI|nr:hypothetical protein HPB50_002822 [Hyalomma asiaticum]
MRALLADYLTNVVNARQLQDSGTWGFGRRVRRASFGYSTFGDFLDAIRRNPRVCPSAGDVWY